MRLAMILLLITEDAIQLAQDLSKDTIAPKILITGLQTAFQFVVISSNYLKKIAKMETKMTMKDVQPIALEYFLIGAAFKLNH